MFADPIEPRPPAFGDKLLSLNWPFILLVSALAGVGVASLYSVAGGSMEPWAESHVIRYCLGLAVLFAVALVDIRLWMRAAYPLYLLALGALILVPLIGVENGGARRWIALGGMSFQPAEFMKIALVLAMARYYQWLSPRHLSNPVALLTPVAMVLTPVALVAVQPDLGTAILFAAIGVGILFLAGASWIYFVFGIVGALAAVPFAWNLMHDYQQRRVLTFLNPGDDPLGAGYHILQSKIALGSGGLMGKGYMQGTQSQLNFLPEKHTDFIFTMFAEEMGFIGA